ncbi:hypothetical protein GGS26DRAFT_557709 [Hypomontagnella submonticulosa]|nr:hypothetical protein GGS26DRAFT_557709 [Hypomontagnella submonticulosa]
MRHTVGLRLSRIRSQVTSHGPTAFVLPLPTTAYRRLGSSQSAAAASPAPAPAQVKSAAELISSNQLSSPLPRSSTLNPPASTRPPPLDLPARDPAASLAGHLMKTGKAYLAFYKAGLRAIFTNRALLAQSSAATPTQGAKTFPSRSDILLRERVRHDLSRLPVFGLLLLVCGEFTPFIVLLFPRLTPYTCRIPKQTAALRRAVQARRDASFRALRYLLPSETGSVPPGMGAGHICRSLGLTSSVWDKIGLDAPLAGARARSAVARIAADDAMIREGGGVGLLVDEEVVLACEDRGMDVMDEPVERLRAKLEEWLRRTTASGNTGASREAAQREAEQKVWEMLLGLGGRI